MVSTGPSTLEELQLRIQTVMNIRIKICWGYFEFTTALLAHSRTQECDRIKSKIVNRRWEPKQSFSAFDVSRRHQSTFGFRKTLFLMRQKDFETFENFSLKEEKAKVSIHHNLPLLCVSIFKKRAAGSRSGDWSKQNTLYELRLLFVHFASRDRSDRLAHKIGE